MKKSILISVLFFAMMAGNLMAQIKVNSLGQVGINNTSPAYQLDISGNLRITNNGLSIAFNNYSFYPLSGAIDLGTSASTWSHFYSAFGWFATPIVIGSDISLKENITDLTLMKEKIKLLRPVSYNLKADQIGYITDPQIGKKQYGFIAQELQVIFPEIVATRDDGMLGIQYTELIPILVQALKEQQQEIDGLTKRISELENVSK